MKICDELSDVLKNPPFFDVVGGCGVDTSGGESPCMASAGVWFKYCPFCGRKIASKYLEDEGSWEWHEEDYDVGEDPDRPEEV